MAKASKQGWALVALDCAVNTSTPSGEAMANVLATFAQIERRLISQAWLLPSSEPRVFSLGVIVSFPTPSWLGSSPSASPA